MRRERFFSFVIIMTALAVFSAISSRAATNTVSFGDVKLGFALSLGKPGQAVVKEWCVTQDAMESVTVDEKGDVRTITWKGHPTCGGDFSVTAVLKKGGDGLWTYAFDYAGQTSEYDVLSVAFPVLTIPCEKDSRVLRPYSQGMLVGLGWDSFKDGEVIGRICSLMGAYRISALVNEAGDSYYCDVRDTGDHPFWSRWCKDAPGFLRNEIWLTVPVTDATRKSFAIPHTGKFGAYCGGWYEAATIYRPWAVSRPRYRAAKAKFDLSKLRNVGLWMWNRGRADNVIPPAERFMKDSGVPVALDWYWWHHNPYDTSYPNFWPPRAGVDAFREAVARLNRAGIFAQVYTNGQRWDCDDPTFAAEGGEKDEMMRRNGTFDRHMYNPFTRHRLTQMCGEAPHYQDKMSGLVKNLRNSGLPSVYLDQIAMTSFEGCYNPNHRHAPGQSVVPGFRAYLERLRRENPGLLFSGEDPNEAYQDLFESVIVCYSSMERYRARYGFVATDTIEMIPLYSALYHGAVALFGSFATMDGITPWDELWPDSARWKEEKPWHELFPDQYAVEFCRGVIWGQQPTVHNFKVEFADKPCFAADYEFTVRAAQFYHAHREWLFDGEMLDPGRLTCAGADVKFLVRGVFAKEGDYHEYEAKGLPTVQHSVWKARDGRIGIALVNWSRQPQDYSVDAPATGRLAGSLKAREWKWLDIRKTKEL